MECQRIACRRWLEYSPLSLPPLHTHASVLPLIDYPEVGPGRILGTSGTSVSASGSTSLSTFGGPFSNTATPTPIGRHGSNEGVIAAIAGGVIGGIAIISILVAVLFFYRRRRRSLAQSPVFDGDIALGSHVDQVSRSISTQGTVSSCFPETPISQMRPYVRILDPPPISASVCSHSSLFLLTLSAWITQLRTLSTK